MLFKSETQVWLSSAKIKSFKNQKGRLISAFPLLAAFHGFEEVVWDDILYT